MRACLLFLLISICGFSQQEYTQYKGKSIAIEWLNITTTANEDNFIKILKELNHDVNEKVFDQKFYDHIAKELKLNPNRRFKELWPNGNVKFKATFKNGLPEGHFHGYYDSGVDAFKGYMEDGKRLGIHISFFPGYSRALSGRKLVYNQQRQLHGLQKMCWPYAENRELALVPYKNGLIDGTTEAAKNSILIEKLYYKNGKLIDKTKKTWFSKLQDIFPTEPF